MQILIKQNISIPGDRRTVKKRVTVLKEISNNNLFTLLFLAILIKVSLSIVFAELKQIYNTLSFLSNHCKINNLNCSFYPTFNFQVTWTWLTDNIVFIVSESILSILDYIRSCEQRNQLHEKYLTHWHEQVKRHQMLYK